MPDTDSKTAAAQWWDAPGPDHCQFCQHGFHVEIGYYCVECDRPVCPLCAIAVHEDRTVLCPHCSAAGED